MLGQTAVTRIRTGLRPVRRAGRRVADVLPVTPLGVLAMAAAGLALRDLGFGQLDLVLLVVGYGALGLGAVCLLLVLIGTVWVRLRVRPVVRDEALVMETGRPTSTGFHVPSLVWLPLVQVRWQWESPPGFEVQPRRRLARIEERVEPSDRGEVRGLVRRVVVQDAFGLCRLAFRLRDAGPIDVLPGVGALRTMPVLTSLAGGDELPHPMGIADGDRVDLRRYVSGDPARFIHWKVFGRTRKLMVRVPERALTRARRTVAYLVAGADDDASAAAARVAVEVQAFGSDWTFGADGSAGDATTPAAAEKLIVRSSAAREQGGRGLDAFLAQAEQSGPAAAVVFVPPRPGPWLAHVVRAATRRRGRMRAVVGIDGTARVSRRAWWRRMLSVSPPRGVTPADDLEAVIRALGGERVEVLVFDRRSGKALGELHRAGMRRLSRAA